MSYLDNVSNKMKKNTNEGKGSISRRKGMIRTVIRAGTDGTHQKYDAKSIIKKRSVRNKNKKFNPNKGLNDRKTWIT